MSKIYANTIIVGGGASGYFTAANLSQEIGAATLILEKGTRGLRKVAISGGGRCNVTHACFDPQILVESYPRGRKELLSLFRRFDCSDTMAWFEERGVALKIEKDGRVFPCSDDSASIIKALQKSVQDAGVKVHTQCGLTDIEIVDEGYIIHTNGDSYICKNLVLTTGSASSVWRLLGNMGYRIVDPVPSLFTFIIDDTELHRLQGIAFGGTQVRIPSIGLECTHDLLITHWGLSGPVILRLSALGARELHKASYRFHIYVNWLGMGEEQVKDLLKRAFDREGGKIMGKANPLPVARRFWHYLLYKSKMTNKRWGDITKKEFRRLIDNIVNMHFEVEGKSTFKEEFVTAGGVDLKEINFKAMESKTHPGLYMAGEMLNIDAVTGGFNFQACWSSGFVIAQSLSRED